MAGLLHTVPGAADIKVEQITGLPVLTVKLNRKEMARYGLNVLDVQEIIEIIDSCEKSLVNVNK